MSDIETLITAPVVVAVLVGAETILRGRQDTGNDIILAAPIEPSTLPIEPLALLGCLAALMLTGAILVALEMRAEARERKALAPILPPYA